jgi:hypothetical protein
MTKRPSDSAVTLGATWSRSRVVLIRISPPCALRPFEYLRSNSGAVFISGLAEVHPRDDEAAAREGRDRGLTLVVERRGVDHELAPLGANI